MKKIKFIIGIAAILSFSNAFGQQDAQYTQYMYGMNIVNPAYAGSIGVPSLGILGRSQWVGVEGAPETFTLTAHAPISDRIGLGLSIIHDEIGPVKEDIVSADFSYTIFTSDEGRIAFGLKVGVSFLDVRELITVDPDPLNIPIHQTSPNFGAGIYYYTNNFYLGLSAPNMLKTRHLEKEGGIVSSASEKMHNFFTSGYVFDIADNLRLKPSIMVKSTSGAPLSVDLSTNLLIDERIEIGLSHRLDDSITGLIGFNVNQDFRIGYAYDHTTSSFGDFNSGSHEILILFEFNKKNVKSPRFF